MLKSLVKNIFFYTSVFLVISYIFKEVIDFLDRENISKLSSKFSRIEDFSLYSIGRDNYYMEGKYVVDYGRRIYINEPKVLISSAGDKVEILSEEAFYYPKEEVVSFIGNVLVLSKDTSLNTTILNISIKDSLAYNNVYNTIESKGVKIEGKNLIFKIDERNMSLEKVKTEIRGRDG
ncbi:MAG: LPS export ABC transporter periplasmic protein LptC [Hydrogenothermaceae bacterium]|nr:LPS export ABC transporter periplasmic protein LptC [Hydrogenothermaceae bacterium]